MLFKPTPLDGAYIIELQRIQDARGHFARAWCCKEFAGQGLVTELVQANTAFNHHKGTVRGMHYQLAPYAETKLVRCTRGAIFDVIVDLRPSSATYCRSFSIRLTDDNGCMLYVPEGFAHGYQTLSDNSEIFYLVSEYYASAYERGVRWDDPRFEIQWPISDGVVISDKDRAWPDYKD
jgi:dTDP-4-dehydrorhamnose 3,5-epimerase